MGFVGLDPEEAVVLADTIEQYATRMALARKHTTGVLQRYPFSDASNFDGPLARVETGLIRHSRELRWRARAMEQAQSVTGNWAAGETPGLALFVATAVFDIETWRSSYRQWHHEQIGKWAATATPRQVADLFAGMSAREIELLIVSDPGLIGGLDGAPPEARYAANRILITNEIAGSRGYLERLVGYSVPYQELDSRIVRVLIAHLTERIDEYQKWLDEGRQILLFDPQGDGRVVEVFGDLAAAGRIAVSVPGMANDITDFSTDDGGFRADAGDLFAEVDDPDVATIAWLGYDTPDHVGAAVRTAAEAGAPSLRVFLEGIDPYSQRNVTVIAHSYGSALAGHAASTGIEANNLVFVGSPGTTLDYATDAFLREDGLVWAALADKDVIAYAISPGELPPPWLPPGLWPVWIGGDRRNGGVEELWHGINPVSDEFGALEFTTDGCNGHSDYYEAGSLENVAKIVLGLHSDVELVDPPTANR